MFGSNKVRVWSPVKADSQLKESYANYKAFMKKKFGIILKSCTRFCGTTTGLDSKVRIWNPLSSSSQSYRKMCFILSYLGTSQKKYNLWKRDSKSFKINHNASILRMVTGPSALKRCREVPKIYPIDQSDAENDFKFF